MTPEQREIARANAQRIVNAGGTDAIDYPVAVGFLSLIAQVEALTVPQEPFTYTVDSVVMSPLEYIEYMHRQYAGERLRADQGWERYESANRDRNALRAALAAPTIPAIPGTKEGA